MKYALHHADCVRLPWVREREMIREHLVNEKLFAFNCVRELRIFRESELHCVSSRSFEFKRLSHQRKSANSAKDGTDRRINTIDSPHHTARSMTGIVVGRIMLAHGFQNDANLVQT